MLDESSTQVEERQGGAGDWRGPRASASQRPADDPVERYPEAATNLRDLPTAWTTFLGGWTWDLFGNHTFREDVHPERAFKTFRLFISIVNRKLYGRRWSKHGQGVRWVCAMERQRRGVVHFHTLLSSPELVTLLRSSWRPGGNGQGWSNEILELWNCLAGFARLEPVESPGAVRGYVSKYVVKGGEIELGGPGMPKYEWTGHPARVDRVWRSTGLGRASGEAMLKRVTSQNERRALMAYGMGLPGSRRATAALRASVRARVGKASVLGDPQQELRPDRSLKGM